MADALYGTESLRLVGNAANVRETSVVRYACVRERLTFRPDTDTIRGAYAGVKTRTVAVRCAVDCALRSDAYGATVGEYSTGEGAFVAPKSAESTTELTDTIIFNPTVRTGASV